MTGVKFIISSTLLLLICVIIVQPASIMPNTKRIEMNQRNKTTIEVVANQKKNTSSNTSESENLPKHRFSVRLSGSKSNLGCATPAEPQSPVQPFTVSSNKSSPSTEIISIPETEFSCHDRRPGYYADREISCRVFHYCNGVHSILSFFCPSCTLFDDDRQLCDYWYNVQCTPE